MEHIVQFGISIDDNRIQEAIEKNAYQSVIDNLVKEAKKQLPRQGYYGNGDVDWNSMAKQVIMELVEGKEEEIIELAADKLADSFKRTKLYKEKMSEKLEEILSE